MAQPLFLGKLIQFFTPGSEVGRKDAFLYASAIVLCSILGAGFLHFFFYSMSHLGMKMRIMSCSLIYRKVSSALALVKFKLYSINMAVTLNPNLIKFVTSCTAKLEINF